MRNEIKIPENFSFVSETEQYIVMEKRIGAGGNAQVSQVQNKKSGELFAAKIINLAFANSKSIKRFKNEIHLCKNIDHSHIIKVWDSGETTINGTNCLFSIMTLLDGTLRDELKKGIQHDKVIPYFRQVLEGIKFAHSKGLVHRDLKPENILIDNQNDLLVITDFGIAHISKPFLLESVNTKPKDRVANFLYAAPEQRDKTKSADHRADIFALGLILNEMFTNQVIQGSDYLKVGAVNKDYHGLDKIIEVMIKQSPNARPDSIDEIISLLDNFEIEFNLEKQLKQIKHQIEQERLEIQELARKKLKQIEPELIKSRDIILSKRKITSREEVFFNGEAVYEENISLFDWMVANCISNKSLKSRLLNFSPLLKDQKYLDYESEPTLFYLEILQFYYPDNFTSTNIYSYFGTEHFSDPQFTHIIIDYVDYKPIYGQMSLNSIVESGSETLKELQALRKLLIEL